MSDISQYTDQIAKATYGEEVRGSIINALNKVNDDNNSYNQIKQDIVNAQTQVDKQVANFDAKVQSAKDVTSALATATDTANTAKTNLRTATDTANTAKTNLVNATSAGDTARGKLETATTNANTAKTNAEKAQANLQGVIDDSTAKKTALQGVIDSATAINNTLGTTNKTASTAKTNLETAISNASQAKSQLEAVITSAGTIKGQLSDIITQANTAKQNLDTSVGVANNTLQSLTVESASAKSNLEELRSENFNSQEILAGVADLRAYLGLSDADILGVQVDYANKTFTRIAGAVGLNAGADFDKFSMFGGRKRCNVNDSGTITAWFGESAFKEDGSNGQVMVYQPKFYYLVCPVVYDKQETGIGYHLRKANYYVSQKPRAGFRLHPAFYDENGNEVDYVLMGAYEGSLYDVSASAYILDDSQVMDYANDKFCSIASAKPTSGLSQDLTRPKIEQMARNRGTGFHLENIKMTSMNQLLMIIEMGMMNLQTAIAQGVVSISDSSAYNCSSLTGSTSSLGNGTGRATQTINTKGDASTTETVNGKTAITYRGLENPWGNIWKFIYGVNLWGNGAMGGGQPFICTDFNYAEGKNSDNYEGAGFTVTNAGGYISAIGYSTTCDWLFMASECLGNSSLPVGDYYWVTTNLNGYRIARLGGCWNHGSGAGAFSWDLGNGVGSRSRTVGGRLVYVPTATI